MYFVGVDLAWGERNPTIVPLTFLKTGKTFGTTLQSAGKRPFTSCWRGYVREVTEEKVPSMRIA